MRKKDVYQLTNPQTSIWNMENFFEGTTINNICTSGIIYEEINLPLLKQALYNVVQKNDSFRIQIHLENSIPFQTINDFKPFDIDIIYVKDEKEFNKIEKEAVNHKFNIIDSNLFCFKIIIFENKFGGVILTLNHIIADSWSLGLTIQEIIKEYHALKNNETLPKTNNSYVEYIKSEQDYKQSEKYINDKKYWNNVFLTIPEQATIPSNKKIKNNISSKAKRKDFLVNADLVAKINDFCKKEKLSVFNFLMAIYSIYIGRVSNLDNFVIGTPILNRTNFKDKHTTGMFVNTVPVRIDIPEDGLFTDFAHALSSNMMSTLKHQKYSYNTILEDLRAKNNSVPNLYNIIISYQITKAFDEQYGKYKTNWTFNNYCGNDFNIHISDINDTGNLLISYDFLTDKYTLKDIESMHKRIVNMIDQIINNNSIFTNKIDIVTKEEKNKILNDFNNTMVDYPKNKTIVDLFEEQVEKTPDNVAVVFEEQKLTYKELNEKANSLARYLAQQGIKPKTVIGLRLNKRLEMIIGILAIIKSGCCYLPINMQYPQDRVEFMLNDSNAKILLGTSESLNDIKIDINKINIDLTAKNIYENDKSNLKLQISPEDLIYIIYTSGSTGTPKGAMLCHRNLVRLFKNDNFLFDFGESDVWTMFHSVAFDFSVWEMYGALLFSGKLVLVSDDVAQDPELFLNLMRKEKVTVLNQTPTYFYKLLKVELEKQESNLNVRYIIFGGEALKPNLIKDWHLKYPNTKLINMYGITETTVHVTYKELLEEDLESPSSNIGIPIPTLHVIIVDKNLNLLPFGVTGEMCVIGEGVFKGYLNREELSNQKLVVKPEYSNSLIYRSGDTAIMHEDGHLEYMGRIDTQVKIRGFRVELGEIEEKILKYSNIDTCIVTKKIDENNRELLCAYYINKGPLNISALRILLNEHLPAYMVPQYFIQIEKVPININGKTDFKALPLPSSANTDKEMIKPKNDFEENIIKIYQKILHVNNISMTDSFFELGGDSLTAINICEHINSDFNVDIKVKDILEKDIIISLANYIANLKAENYNTSKITPVAENEFYPLSSAQKRIYYTTKIIGENNLVYNVPGAILINKLLDKDKVEKCFKKIIRNQSSFRTSFILDNENVKQKIHDNFNFSIPTYENKKGEIKYLINSFPKPFNLEKSPLLRAELHYIENKQTLLLLESHHIVLDGISLEILIKDFCKLYNEDNIDKLEIEYKDFAVWENKFIESDDIKEAENYWVNKFKDSEIPSLNLPYDYNIPSVKSYNGNTISKKIKKDDFKKYVEFAKSLGVSPYIFFISAFFILLYKYTGQEEIIIGSPTTGRDNAQLNNIIGMFVNNIVIDAKINSSNKFTDFLNQIKNEILQDLNYQNYPFDLLVKKLNISTDNSRNPLFDVMFAYQNTGNKEILLDNEPAKIIKSDPKISKFNLTFEINPYTRIINLEYRTDLFKENTINRLFYHYINTLNSIIDNSEILIKNISIISEEEKDLILYGFNNSNFNYDKNKYIHKLFEEQVLKTPDEIAIVFENKKLTYKELNDKANSIANYLKNNNLKANDIVALMLPRSLELIIAMLGVLKSGACYIPIDPTFPEKRIEYMLQNSNTKLLLTIDALYDNIDFKNKYCIDLTNEKLYSKHYKNLNCEINPEDSSYIIYTSGSTGLPKGVILKHKSLTNLCYYLNKNVDFLKKSSKHKNIISITTASFDIFIFETLICLQRGLKVIICNEEEQKVPSKLNELIKENNAQIIQMTPSRMQFFIDNKQDIPYLSNLKYVVLAGEPLPTQLKDALISLGIKKVFNGYGPSETTVFSTFTDVTEQSIINIGNPLYNTQMYILDKDFNIVPTGVEGELYISGDGVGNGYLNLPELTAEKFINNPFKTSLKMYKTGDLCKFDEDGNLHYIERADNQVKIRGLRIELSEIENKILEFPFIKKAKVIKQTINNREIISAYYIASRRIRINDLRKHLNNSLPNYMVPSYFTPLDDFPYTPNGKIDKNALPIPNGILDTSHKYTSPKTDLQVKLVYIWEQILNTKPIGITDNFFELGGDSILAMNLNIQLLKITDKIKYADIFSYPTILELENKINSYYEESKSDNLYDLKNKYDEILCTTNNIPETLNYESPKNILLTGATGFLGIHILDSFLQNEDGKIYTIIRREPGLSPKDKLFNKLHYYFGDKYDKEIDNRIFVIEGDICDIGFGLNQESLFKLINSINTIVNSAAKVSHYGTYQDFYNINVKSVENIINIAKTFNKRLYHVSTLSVSGNSYADQYYSEQQFEQDINFAEDKFYIGQSLENVYIRSKFESEKLILEAILDGIDAYILRVGNLMPRFSDGKFQENYMDNAYINRIQSLINIGCIPTDLTDAYLEFTPIDYTANAILKIIQFSNKFNRIFHIFNSNLVFMRNLLPILEKFDVNFKVVENEEFKKIIKNILHGKNSNILNTLINDFDKDMNLSYEHKIKIDSNFTINYLKLCGFEWPKINSKYLKNILNLAKGE